VYKHLFGHPSGRFYDSIVRFEIHFLWLMSGKDGDCECVLCSKEATRPLMPRPRAPRESVDRNSLGQPKRTREVAVDSGSTTRSSSATGLAPGRPQRQIKAAGAPYAHDEEGTEDIYKYYVKRLEAAKASTKGIEDDIREVNSLDWRAEHEWDGYGGDHLPIYITQIEQQHSFVPRIGELVLWCPHFLDDHYLTLDAKTEEYKFYSFKQKCFRGFPDWRAGVIAAVPSSTTENGRVDFPDILDMPKKVTSLNTAGFRVETFPDPNNDLDKSASKQYRYVPLRNIRPLSHWQVLLRGVPEEKLHPSIQNALTCMTNISLLEKWWFSGEWPTATIRCKGIYLGSELITVGDTVRLVSPSGPRGQPTTCTDVLVVDSIRLNLLDIKSEHILPSSPLLSSASSITLVGRAYTLEVCRHYKVRSAEKLDDAREQKDVPFSPVPHEVVKRLFRPVGADDYGPWYDMHDPAKRYEVSYDQVLGRMYEADAVRLWTGQLQHKFRSGERAQLKPSLDFDVPGITSGRKYATQTDERLPESQGDELLWYWADTRAEALAIETMNGLEVGRYHDIRDTTTLKAWSAQLRIINGQPVTSDLLKFTALPSRKGRPVGSKVVHGKLVKPTDDRYEDVVRDNSSDGDPKSKAKPNSQLASAALVTTDDEEDVVDGDDSDDDDDSENEGDSDDDSHNNNQMTGETKLADSDREVLPSLTARAKEKKEPVATEQIMMSIEGGQGELSDDDAWLNEPVPLARGGTEESEGGDYRPLHVEDEG